MRAGGHDNISAYGGGCCGRSPADLRRVQHRSRDQLGPSDCYAGRVSEVGPGDRDARPSAQRADRGTHAGDGHRRIVGEAPAAGPVTVAA